MRSGSDQPGRYITKETTAQRRRNLEPASEYTPKDDERIDEHIINETMVSLRSNQNHQIRSSPRRFRKVARRTIRREFRWQHGAETDTKRLDNARADEEHWSLMNTHLTGLGPSSRRAGRLKLAMKVLIVMGEMAIVGMAMVSLLGYQPMFAMASSIGLSLALIALPTLASLVAKNYQANKFFDGADADQRQVPRVVWQWYQDKRTSGKVKLWQYGIGYFAAVAAIAFGLGFLISLEPDSTSRAGAATASAGTSGIVRAGPGAKGLATGLILVVTGIGVAAIEFRLTSLPGDLVRYQEDKLRQAKKATNHLDRQKRGPLTRIADADAELLVLELSVGTDFRSRINGARSESAVAGGLGEELDIGSIKIEEDRLTRFIPTTWKPDGDTEEAEEPDEDDSPVEVSGDDVYSSELASKREFLLEMVLVSTGNPPPQAGGEVEVDAGADDRSANNFESNGSTTAAEDGDVIQL